MSSRLSLQALVRSRSTVLGNLTKTWNAVTAFNQSNEATNVVCVHQKKLDIYEDRHRKIIKEIFCHRSGSRPGAGLQASDDSQFRNHVRPSSSHLRSGSRLVKGLQPFDSQQASSCSRTLSSLTWHRFDLTTRTTPLLSGSQLRSGSRSHSGSRPCDPQASSSSLHRSGSRLSSGSRLAGYLQASDVSQFRNHSRPSSSHLRSGSRLIKGLQPFDRQQASRCSRTFSSLTGLGICRLTSIDT
jgi:hypothetical protein